MTTKAIAQIEAALAAGPTDGPWRAEQLEANDGTFFPSFTAMPSGRFHHDPQVDADYIIACNPAAMREVLGHIAAQDAQLAACDKVLEQAQGLADEVIAAQDAEIARLRAHLIAVIRQTNNIEVLGEWTATESNITSGKKLRAEVDAVIKAALAALTTKEPS